MKRKLFCTWTYFFSCIEQLYRHVERAEQGAARQ